ncbi:MAG: zinc-ribbon domain-containing protein [Schaedlerella sp.]|nr:zinc-ribbon domain-containing protein [Schaedlerella sp.]
MAFFNDMDKKLSQLSQGAVKKTKDVSESMRLSAAIKEEENKQTGLYKQIGEYFYQNYAVQAEGQLKELCDAVTKSQETAAQYKDQINTLKGMIYCTNCNAAIPSNSLFCNNCGTRVVQPVPVKPTPTGASCPGCGAPVDGVQLFCVNCGMKLPEQQSVAEPAQVVEEVLETEKAVGVEEVIDAQEEVIPVVDSWEMEIQIEEPVVEAAPFCPACGAAVNSGQMFCTSCGIKL